MEHELQTHSVSFGLECLEKAHHAYLCYRYSVVCVKRLLIGLASTAH